MRFLAPFDGSVRILLTPKVGGISMFSSRNKIFDGQSDDLTATGEITAASVKLRDRPVNRIDPMSRATMLKRERR